MIEFKDVARLPIRDLPLRRIDKATATLYGVRCEVDPETGQPTGYYFPLHRDGACVGYQWKAAKKPGERGKGDTSRVYSDPVRKTTGCLPFGGHLSPPGSGRMVIVTEGAEDCMAATQMLREKGRKYRVVSTLGTDGWKRTLEYFESFEKVAIAFDQDEAGREAAKKFAAALTPGKAVLVQWPEKYNDPNALLSNRNGADLFLDGVNNAKAPEQGGIIYGEAAWSVIQNYSEPEYIPYPPEFEVLNEKLKGMRRGEISLWTSGTGCGKSAFMRRIKQHVIQNTTWRLGDVELEESKEKTIRAILQYQGRKRLKDMTPEEKRAAWAATYGTNRLFTVDRRSRLSKGTSLLSQMKHLHYGYGCDIIMLDHITLAQDEMGEGKEGLAAQDKMMADLLELVESTGLHIALISHLRKSGAGGKSFEEGAMPSLDDLKGSGSVKQIAFDIIALGRNLQHADPYFQNVTNMRVLKNREDGNVGDADRLFYDKATYGFDKAREDNGNGGDDDGAEREF
ncbi:MAG: toprim domain-containing protein [Coriobacteriia bacterium]|jgi:twinkle protein|nr:toprim domain-containing protein [Coriobacteriia bacterium]